MLKLNETTWSFLAEREEKYSLNKLLLSTLLHYLKVTLLLSDLSIVLEL